jgi:hypothetical protein
MTKHTFLFCRFLFLFVLSTTSLWSILKPDEALIKTDVMARLATLRQFVPQKHYRWHVHWICDGSRQYGTLEGIQQGSAHWITLTFASGRSLTFNKSNPRFALYPNKLCWIKPEAFTAPLQDLPGMCIHMIAMPFLNWNVIRCSKTAKLGRRALQVLLSEYNLHTKVAQFAYDLHTEVFLDKHFNTILQAKLWDSRSDFRASFTLKHLKKFKSGWALRTAEFTLNNRKTLLYVDEVETLE